MGNYNFEDDDNGLGETRRLDTINDQVKKQNQTRRTPNEEPYRGGEQREQNRESYRNNYRGSQKKGSGQYKLFIGIAIAAGILVFVLVFFIAIFSFKGGSGNNVNSNGTKAPFTDDNKGDITKKEDDKKDTSNEDEENEDDEKETEESKESDEIKKAVITNINGKSEILVYDKENDKNIRVDIDSDTKFLDKFGEKYSLSKLSPHDVVDISIEDGKAVSVKVNSRSFKIDEASAQKINLKSQTLEIYGHTYTYDEQTTSFVYGNDIIKPSELSEYDVFTAKGVDDEIYFIEVKEYHATLQPKNNGSIQNGYISIDGEKAIKLDGTSEIAVSPGSHSIKVTGDNIETYIDEISVDSEENYEIDLSQVTLREKEEEKPKTGTISINANVSDFILYINGERVNYTSNSMVYPLGQYTIKIEKDGYNTFEKTVNLTKSSLSAVINASLEKAVEKGTIIVTTTPISAQIYFDGEYKGMSPVSITSEYGSHSLTIKSEGYQEVNKPIEVNMKEVPLTIELKEQ